MRYELPPEGRTTNFAEAAEVPCVCDKVTETSYYRIGRNMKALGQLSFTALLLIVLASCTTARADVLELKIDDQITPASAEVITSAIARAEREGASCLIITRDEPDLLAQLDGRTVTRVDGSQLVVHVADEKLVAITPTIRQRLLMALADPRIAFILFAIGALCVYFEFQHPGAIIPGVAGTISVVLALYGFHMLPINLTGVVLILAAIGLFVLEAKVGGFGVLGLGGIVAAVVGSLILIDVPNPELRLPLKLVLAVVIPFGVIFTFVLRLAIRARRSKVTTGTSGMIGLTGRAQTAIAPEGMVFVRGELWRARSQTTVPRGENVRVTAVDGLTLDVKAE